MSESRKPFVKVQALPTGIVMYHQPVAIGVKIHLDSCCGWCPCKFRKIVNPVVNDKQAPLRSALNSVVPLCEQPFPEPR